MALLVYYSRILFILGMYTEFNILFAHRGEVVVAISKGH